MMEDTDSIRSPLSERLVENFERMTQQFPQNAVAFNNLIKRLKALDVQSISVQCGQQMPPFLLPDQNGQLVGMEDLLSDGPLVVSFNHGHWCTFCEIELAELREYHAEIESVGGKVITIIPDRRAYALKLKEQQKLQFPVLTDVNNGYALLMGLVVPLGKEVRDILGSNNFDVAAFQGNEGLIVPTPATYIVDGTGLIIGRHVESDFRSRMSGDEILNIIRKYH